MFSIKHVAIVATWFPQNQQKTKRQNLMRHGVSWENFACQLSPEPMRLRTFGKVGGRARERFKQRKEVRKGTESSGQKWKEMEVGIQDRQKDGGKRIQDG